MPPASADRGRILAGLVRRLLAVLAAFLAWLGPGPLAGLCLGAPSAAIAAITASPAPTPAAANVQRYLCDGEPLQVERVSGAVDAVGIPNTLAGTLPGAYLVLRWQGVQLPLPRTNNAGSPSYSDGKWAWREDDPTRPLLRLRRPGGDVQEFRCVPEA